MPITKITVEPDNFKLYWNAAYNRLQARIKSKDINLTVRYENLKRGIEMYLAQLDAKVSFQEQVKVEPGEDKVQSFKTKLTDVAKHDGQMSFREFFNTCHAQPK